VEDLHLSRLSFYLDLLRPNEVRFEFPPPLHCSLYPLLRVGQIPLRGAAVPCHGIRFVEPSEFPRVVGILGRE
jgi:hypothetical protein